MTDPNTPTASTNPQDLIDQALGGAATPTVTPTDTTEPTLPAPEPLSTPPVTEPVVEQKSEEVVSIPTTDKFPVELSSTQPEPMAMPEPPKESKPMTEDMPLAFAVSEPSSTPEPSVVPLAEPTMPVVPPVLTNPAATEPAGAAPKKKKGLKVVGLIVGFFVMFGVVGAVSYQMITGQSLIAAIYEPKFTRDDTGKVIRNPNFDPDALIKNDKGELERQEDVRNRELNIKQEDVSSGLPAEKAGSPGNCGTSYAWCGGGISKCVSFDALEDAGGGCNKYGEVKYGIASVYGANPGQGACDPDDVRAELATECSCGSKTYCFDRRGSCNSTQVERIGDKAGTVDTGLCGLVGWIPAGTSTFKEYPDLFCTQADVDKKVSGCDAVGDLKYEYSCDINGCKTSDAACQIVSYACDGTSGSNSCTDNADAYIEGSMTTGNSKTFDGKCGTVEQIDVTCGGYKMSRTRINPECQEGEEKTTDIVTTPTPSPSPSPSGSVSLMCTGLTRTPTTTPKIGDKLTFTCTGASTPAGAVSLSYKFRYNVNSGAYVTLVNKTATTAEMTIASCGTYKVQCQTCGTINGTLTCDPVWTSATVQ